MSAASGQGARFISAVGAGLGQGTLRDGQVLAEPVAHERCTALLPRSLAPHSEEDPLSWAQCLSLPFRNGQQATPERKNNLKSGRIQDSLMPSSAG